MIHHTSLVHDNIYQYDVSQSSQICTGIHIGLPVLWSYPWFSMLVCTLNSVVYRAPWRGKDTNCLSTGIQLTQATYPNSWKDFIFCVCRIFTGFWHWSRISTHAKEPVAARGKLPPLTLYFTCSCYCCFWIHLKNENLFRSSRIAYIYIFSFHGHPLKRLRLQRKLWFCQIYKSKVFVRLLSKLVERRRNYKSISFHDFLDAYIKCIRTNTCALFGCIANQITILSFSLQRLWV